MFPCAAAMSNSTASLSEEAASVSSGTTRLPADHFASLNPMVSTISPPQQQQPQKIRKKRSLPGNPDPDAEVIALSPKTLLTTNRFVCEICNKGFQRDQNLQLHRRGHNLPWKLKQRNSKDIIRKRAYVCPEPSCVHHHPSRALGDLTGIKKHFCRKHGEKKWKCEKCSKIYAVQSDWKAHSKTCGTREYRCDCGTLFSRKDSFITHRAFCDALAEESARLSAATTNPNITSLPQSQSLFPFSTHQQQQQHFTNPPPFTTISLTPWDPPCQNPNPNNNNNTPQNPLHHIKPEAHHFPLPTLFQEPPPPPPQHHHKGLLVTSPFQNLHVSTQPTSNPATSSAAHLSATALLQKAATVGASAAQQSQSAGHNNMAMPEFGTASHMISTEYLGGFTSGDLATWHKTDRLTRDFLGLTGDGNIDGTAGNGNGNGNGATVRVPKDMLTYTGGVEFQQPYYNDRLRASHALLKPQGFGFAETHASETWGDC